MYEKAGEMIAEISDSSHLPEIRTLYRRILLLALALLSVHTFMFVLLGVEHLAWIQFSAAMTCLLSLILLINEQERFSRLVFLVAILTYPFLVLPFSGGLESPFLVWLLPLTLFLGTFYRKGGFFLGATVNLTVCFVLWLDYIGVLKLGFGSEALVSLQSAGFTFISYAGALLSTFYVGHCYKEVHEKYEADLEGRNEYNERALRNNNRFLDSVIENIPAMVAVKDAQTLRYVRLNRAGEELFGTSRGEFIGRTSSEIFGPELGAGYEEKDHEALESGQLSETDEEIIYSNDQGPRLLCTKKIPICDDSGKAKYVLGISEDITEKKRMSEGLQASNHELELRVEKRTNQLTVAIKSLEKEVRQREETQAELEDAIVKSAQASESKSQFLANISHEIRTPLGVVQGYSELLQDTELSESDRKVYCEAVFRNCRLLNSIVNDVLDLSKIEAGKLSIKSEQIVIRDLLTELFNGSKLKAHLKGLKFGMNIEDDVPESIETDPNRLRQILVNLIGNAIKFCEQGEVFISVERASVSGVQSVRFLVEDTGIGISDEFQGNVFEAFTQEDGSITRRFGGTGLGLTLCRKMARCISGQVKLVKSKKGQGSVFALEILLPTLDKETVGEKAMVGPSQEPQSALGKAFKGKRFLVVDDSQDNQNLLSIFITSNDGVATVCENGKEALKALDEHDFDVVLLDLQMPVMDGYETISQLRKNDYSKPVIALTGHAFKEERDKCLKAGFSEHIGKPVGRNEFVKKISNFL